MKVEVLLDKYSNIQPTVLSALEQELKKRITKLYPDASFRIAESSSTNIQVSGANSDDKTIIMDIIQQVWESSDWLPE